MANLRKRTLSGLGWSGASQFFGQGLQFVISAVLARLLSPREYGLLGMVVVFTGFATSFSDLSLGASIIQKQDVSKKHLSSVFWINVLIGGFLSLVFLLLSPLIADFYSEPALRTLTAVLAFTFTVNSLNVVQTALLDKSLNFRAKFQVDVVSISIAGTAALVMALSGAGVWSLVGQTLIVAMIRVAVMWRLSDWRPQMSFDWSAIKELMRFSKHLVGFGVVHYWSRNFDKLLIGRLLGSAALGIYGLSDRLMRLPLTNVTNITHSVMFPALSAMQQNVEGMKRVYLRANRMIAVLTFPLMTGLCVLAEPVIVAVYGNKWQGAIAVVQILCFAGMSQSVYNTASWIFLSRGRTDILFRLGVYATAIRIAGVFVGIHWGLTGVAWAYVLGGVLIWYPTWASAGRLIQTRFYELLKNLAGPFYCSAAMGALIWTSDKWMFGGQPIWLRLAVEVPAGILIYWFLINQFQLLAWKDVRDAVLEMGGRQSRFVQWLLGGDSQVTSE